MFSFLIFYFFFFTATATTEIYTLSLHDALPILIPHDLSEPGLIQLTHMNDALLSQIEMQPLESFTFKGRSEEHTSELQSHSDLVCRLLLEKKKKKKNKM